MLSHSRYHIPTHPVAAPAAGYPVEFHFDEGGAYIKYGHQVFLGSSQRGDEYWTAEIITQTWYMAETGRIPISGAGYGGKFAGPGFEGIWLDMSEIVRPTRDGIHGREYISTQVDLGGNLVALQFDPDGHLLSRLPPMIQLPVPVIFNPLPIPLPGSGALHALIIAAERLRTLALIDPRDYPEALSVGDHWMGARLSADTINEINPGWKPDYIEIEEPDLAAVLPLFEEIRHRYPEAVIAARLPLSPQAGQIALDWVRAGLPVIHLYADEIGQDAQGNSLPASLHAVHTRLVEQAERDKVTLVASGGIAAAEHVAKAIACGADLVAIDFILQVAWGCALWADKARCPAESEEIPPEWGAQRVVNLINAWRDQLLEALGAMGMREVRRLRGEIGRTIWHDVEEAAFRKILGGSAPLARYPRLPQPKGGEGDFRWPTALLLASQEQARTGRPLTAALEYRIGASEGGFDRLAFAFELDADPRVVVAADPAEFDLSLPLNRRDQDRPAITLPLPWYGAGMSYGSVGLPVMLARARAAQHLGTFSSTGEGGYPEELIPYADHIITQVATGLFGVSEATIQRARVIEIKYAQGAKPGLGGHLLGIKTPILLPAFVKRCRAPPCFRPSPSTAFIRSKTIRNTWTGSSR